MNILKNYGEKVGSGNFGETTRKLHKIYWNKHHEPSWSLSIKDILY